MNIIFSGIGGIGGYYGARVAYFTEALQSVHTYFFMREGEHLASVRARGLHLTTPSTDIWARPTLATACTQELPVADVLFLATKSYDALANIDQLRPVIAPHTIVVPMHNGIDIPPMIQAALPDNLVLPGACYIMSRRSVGEIQVLSDSNIFKFGIDTRLGRELTLEEHRRAEWIYTLLCASRVSCKYFTEIAPYLREKYLNLSPSATATTYYDVPIGEVLDDHLETFKGLIAELATLYRRAGWESDPDLETKAYDQVLRMPRTGTTSMHSDIAAGHRSEVESLVGYVVRTAEQYGLDVPLYRQMYTAILKRIGR